MPRKHLNSFQLELRFKASTARIKRVEELNKRNFTLAQQSGERERKRRLTLALAQKLVRKPQAITSQRGKQIPGGIIGYLEGSVLGIIIGLLFSLCIDLLAQYQYHTMTYYNKLVPVHYYTIARQIPERRKRRNNKYRFMFYP
jgi:hypothetical protein